MEGNNDPKAKYLEKSDVGKKLPVADSFMQEQSSVNMKSNAQEVNLNENQQKSEQQPLTSKRLVKLLDQMENSGVRKAEYNPDTCPPDLVAAEQHYVACEST
jgi:hypothetical protein